MLTAVFVIAALAHLGHAGYKLEIVTATADQEGLGNPETNGKVKASMTIDTNTPYTFDELENIKAGVKPNIAATAGEAKVTKVCVKLETETKDAYTPGKITVKSDDGKEEYVVMEIAGEEIKDDKLIREKYVLSADTKKHPTKDKAGAETDVLEGKTPREFCKTL